MGDLQTRSQSCTMEKHECIEETKNYIDHVFIGTSKHTTLHSNITVSLI